MEFAKGGEGRVMEFQFQGFYDFEGMMNVNVKRSVDKEVVQIIWI